MSIESIVQDFEPAKAIVAKFGDNNFSALIDIGNLLVSAGRYSDAIEFFDRALVITPLSKHVLLRKLGVMLIADMEIESLEVEKLKEIDFDYYKLFMAKSSVRRGDSPNLTLEILDNSFEGFESGSEADSLFIGTALASGAIGSGSASLIARRHNLFFYWDSETPPSEILDNVKYHKDFEFLNVKLFNREMARDFLKKNFGRDVAKLFSELRHPSEESDFFRFHAVYQNGGFYLDVDEKIRSMENLNKFVGELNTDVYIKSSSGPIESAFFGAVRFSPVIAECLRILIHNCYLRKNLSMWLKTGPGPITRAIARMTYNRIKGNGGEEIFRVLPHNYYPMLLDAVDVSYRNDNRDWRVFEASQKK